MKIEVLVVPDCPHETPTIERVRRALAVIGLPEAVVAIRMVTDQEEAVRLGFAGSPTIWIDGRDPFAEPRSTPVLSCRMYRTTHGLEGVPELDELRRALHDALDRQESLGSAHDDTTAADQ